MGLFKGDTRSLDFCSHDIVQVILTCLLSESACGKASLGDIQQSEPDEGIPVSHPKQNTAP